MNGKKLSQRSKQPGHDLTYRVSEANAVEAAKQCLSEADYIIEAKPTDLSDLFADPTGGRTLGLRPELKIESRKTGRKLFIEVKKQGDHGNAEERAMKHHTLQFRKTLHARYGYPYHPYVTIFCEALAVNPRYTTKFPYMIEPDHYFLWINYELPPLRAYLQSRCAAWLD
jgi:hypothetical protein